MDRVTIASRVKARKLMRDRGKKRRRNWERNYVLLSDGSGADLDPEPESEEHRFRNPPGEDMTENTAMSDKTLSENESVLVRKRTEKRRNKYGSHQPSSSKGKNRASSSGRSVEMPQSASYRLKRRENGSHLSMESGDSLSGGRQVVVFGANRPARRNKRVPVGDGIDFVTETLPCEPVEDSVASKSRSLISEPSKDYEWSEYIGSSSDELEDPTEYFMSTKEIQSERVEDYDWRDIGKVSAEFQEPSGSISRRKRAEFQEPCESGSGREIQSERAKDYDWRDIGKVSAEFQEPSGSISRRKRAEFQEPCESGSGREIQSERAKDYDWRDIGKVSAEFQEPSGSISRRKRAEFQEPCESGSGREIQSERAKDYDWRDIGKVSAEFQEPSGSISRRKRAKFQEPSESGSRRSRAESMDLSKSRSRKNHSEFKELSKSMSRDEFRHLRKSMSIRNRSESPELSKSRSRKNRDEFKELHSESLDLSKSRSRKNHVEFKELSKPVSRRNVDVLQELNKSRSRKNRDGFQELSKFKSRRDCYEFQQPSGSRRYRDELQEPSGSRRYCDELQELSGSRRHRDELQEPSDSKSRRYRTAFHEPAEPMPRRNRTEFQEPSDSRSRRYRAQLQEAREPMPRRDREKEFIHPEEPVQPAGPAETRGDTDVVAWMKYYHCKSENYTETKRRAVDDMEEEPEYEETWDEEEPEYEETEEEEEEEYVEKDDEGEEDEEEEDEQKDDEGEEDEEEEDEQKDEEEEEEVEVFHDNNRTFRTWNPSDDGIVLVGERPGSRNFARKPKKIQPRQRLMHLEIVAAEQRAESNKRPDQQQGANSEIPVPVAVKEEMVDEEEFELAAKPEIAEPSRPAEAASPKAVQGNPTRKIVDWDDVASPSSSSAADSSDTDHDDEDYRVGLNDSEGTMVSLSDEGESIAGEPIKKMEAEKGDAAATSVPAKEDVAEGENRRFKRLRKELSHTVPSVDLQDHILGAIFGNGNAQGNAAPNGIPEEANVQEDTPAADLTHGDDMTKENAEEGTPEDHMMEENAEEGSQAAESASFEKELCEDSNAATGGSYSKKAMMEENGDEESAAAESKIVANGVIEEGTATTVGIPSESEKAMMENNAEQESATTESAVKKGLVEEGSAATDDTTIEKAMTKEISDEESAADESTPGEKDLAVESTATNDDTPNEKAMMEKNAEEGNGSAESTPGDIAAADGSGSPGEKLMTEESAAADDTPWDANAKEGKGTNDELLCYTFVSPNEKKSSGKYTEKRTADKEKPPANMVTEGRSHGTERARPSDANRESRTRKSDGPEPGSSKRSRRSQEIVLVGETTKGAAVPQHPQSSHGHQKPGSSNRSHRTGKRDEIVMVTERKKSASRHQAPASGPSSHPKGSNGHQAPFSGPRARPERSSSHQAPSSGPRARPQSSSSHQALSLGPKARAETSSSHQALSSGPRARPETSYVPQAPSSAPIASSSHQVPHSSPRALPESSSSHQVPPLVRISHPQTSSRHPERDNGKEQEEEDDNEEQSKIQNKPVPKQKKLLTALINSIVGGGNIEEVEEEEEDQQEPLVEPSSWNGPTLPKKFRFEDEDPEPVVLSEYDLMVEGLFKESGMNEGLLGYEDNPPQQEETKEEEPPEEEEPSCPHEFYIQEPIGRICRLCFYIETEMRYLDLPFAPDPFRPQRSSDGDRERISKLKEGMELSPEEADQLGDAFSADKGTVWDAIPGAKSRMYEHQQEGFEFMWKNLEGTINLAKLKKSEDSDIGGCIISHAPGTGKTLLTLMFINAYLKIFPNSRPMIIAPASMLLTWEEEFKKWNIDFHFHNLNHVELTGKERKILNFPVPTGRAMDKDVNRLVKIYSWTKERSVLGISYNLFENLVGGEYKKVISNKRKQKQKKKKKKAKPGQRSEKYKRMLLEMPRLVIMDEGHTPRNSNSCIWNTVLKLQTKRKIILTGTPFQNNFLELFNTLRLVRPETADSLLKEKTMAPMLAVKGGKYVPKKKKAVETSETNLSVDQAIVKLKDIISPFVHVHKGYILKRSLPGLKDSVLLLKPPPMQKYLIKLIEGAKGVSSFDYEYKVALLSTHPSLAVHCSLDDRERAAINMDEVVSLKDDYKEGVKTRFVMELVRLSIDQGEKVLVFSQYQQIHKLMEEQLRAFFNWEEGKQVIQMHGKQDQKVRQQLITKFNDPKSEAVVLLASTKCCSEGINLVGASRVVLLDVVWNPSVERQAISRAYRLGQQKVVHTYHLMAGGTTEGDKYCRQVEKDRLSELVFSSTTKEAVPEKVASSSATATASASASASASGVGDVILHSMLEDENFKDMVEKIIYQPKEVNLIESFTLASADDQA